MINSWQVALRALGFDVKKPEVQKILKDFDRDGTGKIAERDFYTVGACIACVDAMHIVCPSIVMCGMHMI